MSKPIKPEDMKVRKRKRKKQALHHGAGRAPK